jgi:hypothetical protein
MARTHVVSQPTGATLMFLALFVGACSGIPMPRLPQIEQAAQVTQGGGERYRAHGRCLEDSHTSDELVACMRREKYVFLPQRQEYPSSECWEARNNEEAPANLPAHCFERAPDPPS